MRKVMRFVCDVFEYYFVVATFLLMSSLLGLLATISGMSTTLLVVNFILSILLYAVCITLYHHKFDK